MPTQVRSREIDREAYELRVEHGANYREIAERFAARGIDITYQNVWQAVQRHARRNHLPTPSTRRPRAPRRDLGTLTFGVEIEFRRVRQNGVLIDPSAIAAALTAAGVPTRDENYNHSTRSYWKLIHDASSDRELVSPILRGEEGLTQIKSALRVLRELGCRVGRSEGFHVHIGAGHLDATQIVQVVEGYHANQDLIDSLLARSRRTENHPYYCSGLSLREITSLREQAARHEHLTATNSRNVGDFRPYADRYRVVNLQALQVHGTIEFRQHQGTLNGTKATTWVRLLLGLFTAATAGPVARYSTVAELATGLGLGRVTVRSLARRAGESPAPAPAPAEVLTALDAIDTAIDTAAVDESTRNLADATARTLAALDAVNTTGTTYEIRDLGTYYAPSGNGTHTIHQLDDDGNAVEVEVDVAVIR